MITGVNGPVADHRRYDDGEWHGTAGRPATGSSW